MAYAKLPNINRLQRQNDKKIFSVIDKTTVINSSVERGEDLDSDSPIEDVLYNWADDIIKDLNSSWEAHGFNPASNSGKFEPYVIDRAGVLKVLQLSPANDSDAWKWADTGRRPTKNGHKAGTPYLWQSLEEWITYRGINVKDVQGWKRKNDKGKTIKPYKNISNTLKLRNIMARSFAKSIHKKGTIKRFDYKGSQWFSSVVNDKAMEALSIRLSEAVGYNISVRIAQSI